MHMPAPEQSLTALCSANPDAMKMSESSPVAAFEITQRPEQSIYGVI
jgi:hypothetical protein